MKEILKVKLSDQTLSLTEEAYSLLEGYIEAIRTHSGEAEADAREAALVEHILDQQPATTVVEVAVVESAIASIGYPEGCPPAERKSRPRKPQTQTPQQTSSINNGVGPLGKAIIIFGKVVLGILLAVWLLTAIGLLVGFVMLMAIGDIWADYLALPMEGLSPVVFAGLICAVVVLFMGLVADVGFALLRSKRVNLKRLAIGGVIWLIFCLWLLFASVRNFDNWQIWAHQSVAKIEQWDRDYERWEDDFEEQVENAIFNPTVPDGVETNLTFYLNDLADSLKLDKLCEEFKEIGRFHTYIFGFLVDAEDGKEVVVSVTSSQTDNVITRQTIITTPKDVITIDVNVDATSGNLLKYDEDIKNTTDNK